MYNSRERREDADDAPCRMKMMRFERRSGARETSAGSGRPFFFHFLSLPTTICSHPRTLLTEEHMIGRGQLDTFFFTRQGGSSLPKHTSLDTTTQRERSRADFLKKQKQHPFALMAAPEVGFEEQDIATCGGASRADFCILPSRFFPQSLFAIFGNDRDCF